MGVKRSPDVVSQAEWVRPIAGVVLGARVNSMRDNFVGGSESFGYIVRGDTCGEVCYLSVYKYSFSFPVFIFLNSYHMCSHFSRA